MPTMEFPPSSKTMDFSDFFLQNLTTQNHINLKRELQKCPALMLAFNPRRQVSVQQRLELAPER